MRAALAIVILLVSACAPASPAPRGPHIAEAAVGDLVSAVAADAQATAGTAAERVRVAAASAALPAMLDMQQAIETALPPPAASSATAAAPVAPDAVALIVRHEIISPAFYTARLQGFACPGDISGPTIGIGYDLGMQTAARIRADWHAHPGVPALAAGSGEIGFGPCRNYRSAHAGIRTPLPLAQTVFEDTSLPTYHALTARTFRNGWDSLPPNAQGALVATVYVRGAGMRGESRTEMRTLRDTCVPAHDVQCIAAAHRAMCARFEGRADAAGLCKRFLETAALAVRT